MSNIDGMNYAPKGKPAPVVEPGEFSFAAAFLDHGHINGQCNGLLEAGAELRAVYDPDPKKVEAFCRTFPQARPVDSFERILDDPNIQLVASAAIPNRRGEIGRRVLRAGKDYFSDKTPFTTLEQLAAARQAVNETGRRYFVYYSERLHVESAVFAGDLIRQNAIGKVLEVVGFGPHLLNAPSRPAWFFDKEQYGGILCDIGSHQFEQFLYYSGSTDATVNFATVANRNNPDYPELEDFGEAHLLGNSGATNFVRVDWLTPRGSRTWGDGRVFILGTDGYIEIRKYIEVGRGEGGDQLYLVNQQVEEHHSLNGKVGFPFFGEMILDCLNGTEKAMTQAHIFKAAELCLQAQQKAVQLG